MRGQWVGRFSGTADGLVIVNCDEDHGNLIVEVMLSPDLNELPRSLAIFEIPGGKLPAKVIADVAPYDPNTLRVSDWSSIRHLFGANVVHASKANVSFNINGFNLTIDATTNVGGVFKTSLWRLFEGADSGVSGVPVNWNEFKEEIAKTAGGSYVYRGQKQPWALKSSFHRNGRFRLSKFIAHDIPDLHRRLSALTRHFFDLSDGDQYGAFLNLMQHHGYPTPLLDWTYSPYVAAFFAFRKVKLRPPFEESGTNRQAVRIFVFDLEAWQKKVNQQVSLLNPPFPHVSALKFISLENPRVVPQQAMITSSNLEDIESYIKAIEGQTNTTFLKAFDIPYSEATEAMKDLAFMGITAGSIFPGIDGVCEEFKERNFDV